MTGPDNFEEIGDDHNSGESAEDLTKAALEELLLHLTSDPSEERIAEVQHELDVRIEAMQHNIDDFRFILTYLDKKLSDSRSRSPYSLFPYTETPPPYSLAIEDTVPVYDDAPVKRKFGRIVLRQPIGTRTEVRFVSVMDLLRVTLPENWTDLVSRYVEYPNHREMQGYQEFGKTLANPPVDEADPWSVLKNAKIELAQRYKIQDEHSGTDLAWWGYQPAIDEQIKVVNALHQDMGLIYENHYLVENTEA
jgi:hypothetical protein